jgi:hypothetical protein
MRRLLFIWAAFLCGILCVSQSEAFWQSRDSNYNIGIATGGGYSGPNDLGFGAATAWFGFRCFGTAYTGNVADIVDASTGSTTGSRLVCSAGGTVSALVSASACTFVTGNVCSAIATTCLVACNVVTLYDQTAGNNCTSATCNVTQATNASRPAFLFQSASCGTNSGLSCMQCPATPAATPLQSATALGSTAQTYFMSLVYNSTASGGQDYATTGGVSLIDHGAAANTVRISTGGTNTATVTATDSTWHAIQATFAGSASVIDLDGSSTTGLSAGAGAASGKFTLCSSTSATGPMTGFIAEFGMWPSASTFSNSTMTTNQQAFYGGL